MGWLKPVHGPFTYGLAANGKPKEGKLGPDRKLEIRQAIKAGECECRLCAKHGQRKLPRDYMFMRMAMPGQDSTPWMRRPTWIFPKTTGGL